MQKTVDMITALFEARASLMANEIINAWEFDFIANVHEKIVTKAMGPSQKQADKIADIFGKWEDSGKGAKADPEPEPEKGEHGDVPF